MIDGKCLMTEKCCITCVFFEKLNHSDNTIQNIILQGIISAVLGHTE